MTIGGRILVTGAGGFLGSRLVECGKIQGLEVIGSCRHTKTAEQVSLDVCHTESVEAAFQSVRPSLVIHCASYGVNYADQDPDRALAVNTFGALRILVQAAQHGVTRFVHLGSCFEYGHKSGAISEEACLNPTAVYGATKAAATMLLRERAAALGVNLIIVRPFSMWGPGEGMHRIIPQVVAACLNRVPLKLTGCEVLRDYMYVDDVAEAILALAGKCDIASGSIVNVGSGQSLMLRDFVLAVAALLDGVGLMQFGELPYRKTEMTSLVADVRRLLQLVGDRRLTPLSDGVRRMVLGMETRHRLGAASTSEGHSTQQPGAT